MDLLLLTLLFIVAGCGIEWRRAMAEKEREHFVQLRAHWLRTVYGAQVGCDYGDCYCAWTERSCRKIHFFDNKVDFEKFKKIYGVPAQAECKVWTQKIPGIEEIWEMKQI